MKAVVRGFLYKANNIKRGRQAIKFYKEGSINIKEQSGTSIIEILKILNDKLSYEQEFDTDSNTGGIPSIQQQDDTIKLKAAISSYLQNK